jgi:hypothetical protein
MTDSPWMSTQQVAAYAGRHFKTVRLAAAEYVSSGGRCGLKGGQRGTNCSWRFHREDVDRWIRGEAPARGGRRLSAARST